jgi:hypothetical protein
MTSQKVLQKKKILKCHCIPTLHLIYQYTVRTNIQGLGGKPNVFKLAVI